MKERLSLTLNIIQTLVLILILAVLVINGREPKPKQIKAQIAAQQKNTEPITLNEHDVVWGSIDAPFTLVAYIDYECPYCKNLYKSIKEIEDDYIETGKVKVVFRDLPLKMHEHAETIAAASECARKQGKFWELAHLALTNTDPFREEILQNWARKLDIELNEECLEDPKTRDVVREDIKDARSRRLTGTPAIFINDTYYRGTMPASDLKLIFEGKEPEKKKGSGACNPK